MPSEPDHERLAIDGGRPSCPAGPPRWPLDDLAVEAALKSAYRDGSWGQYHGRHADALIETMRSTLGTDYVSLCASGTVAVELALRGLRVTTDDEVLLAGYDFPGNFRAVTALGARPVLVDVVQHGVTLDRAQLDAALSTRTRAVIVSHLHGTLAPIVELCEWSGRHGLALVEDACQAVGATIAGRPAGTWGDAGVFSFGGSKLLTAGRGGAVVTAHAEVQQRIRIHCEQGNHAYPLSELQAAVLLPQWHSLAQRHAQRRAGVQRLLTQLAGVPALKMLADFIADEDAAFYKLAWLYDPAECGGRSRAEFVAAVNAEGVSLGTGFRSFAQRSIARARRVNDLPHSRAAGEQIVLLHHPVLLEPAATLDHVAQAIRRVVSAWTK